MSDAPEPHVEFVPPATADAEDERELEFVEDRSMRRRLVGAAVLQFVAAVLCVVAPFLAVWTLRAQDVLDQVTKNTSEISTNGWGVASLPGNGRGPAFGVILALAAVLLIAAAVTRIREVAAAPPHGTGGTDIWWTAEPARALGVAGSALLLGGAGSFLLVAINIASQEADVTSASSPDASIGAGTWLAVLAWVVSASAVAMSESVLRQQRRVLELSLSLEEPRVPA